jgi:hypothetical protein
MVEIDRRALRKARSLAFCYLCGKELPPPRDPARDIDHVPPKKVFKVEDRRDELILPTHTKCNHDQSPDDEQIAHLIGLLHGRRFGPRERKLKVSLFHDGKGEVGLVHIDLERMIWRWVRGFHAALYREHLPDDAHKQIQAPMTAGRRGEKGLEAEEVLPQQFDFVEIITRNRALGRLDRAVTQGGKCIYECVWIDVTSPDEAHACVFALKLYNWSELGETDRTVKRGCTGFYGAMHLPVGATAEIQEPNRKVSGSLDAFPEPAAEATEPPSRQ